MVKLQTAFGFLHALEAGLASPELPLKLFIC